MKATALKHSRNRHRKAPSIALFPFLAVLICTMGALVPLLLGIARQARLQATQAAKVKAARQHLDLQADREAVTWRVQQLTSAKQATDEQLKAARFKLGHLEDHARRLRGQAAELEAAWNDLQGADSQAARQRGDLEAQRQQIQAQLSTAERELVDAKREAGSRQPSYAILPYDGKNKTRRRPIYIECTDEAVILQPEGVRLAVQDFFGPMGPGNPLAASLRAIREYWVVSGGFDAEKDGEPYPLLLVRPSGALAYYAVREAINSWGTDFGYEMIEEDWKLQFPPADARLAMLVERTLDKARIDQKRLIARAPRAYDKPKPVFQVSPTSGGVRRVDGGRDDRAATVARATGQVGRRYGGTGGGSESMGEAAPGGAAQRGMQGGGPGGSGQGGMSDSDSVASLYGGVGTRAATTAPSARAGTGGYGPGYAGYGPTGSGSGSAGPAGAGYGSVRAGGGNGSGGSGYGPAGSSGDGYATASPRGAGYGPAGAGNGNGIGTGTGGADGTGTFAGGGMTSGTGAAGDASGADGGTGGLGGTGGTAAGPVAQRNYPSLGNPGGGATSGGGCPQGNCPTGGAAGGETSLVGTSSGGAPGQRLAASGAAGDQASGPVVNVLRPEGYVAGRPGDQDLAQNAPIPPAAGQQMGSPLRPGEWHEPPPRMDKPPEPPKDKAKDKKKPERDLAKSRQRDWGLRDAASGSTPVSRPIHVDCYHDQLVISPARNPRVVPIKGRTNQAVDAIVSAVWSEMESWGIAGRGMYWKPILQTRVAPGGEERFQDLQRLLEGSGLTLERR